MSKDNRHYYGVTIKPIGKNSSGMKWIALIDGHGFVKGDTLQGIKSLIRAKTTEVKNINIKARRYYGAIIKPYRKNASGLRWIAHREDLGFITGYTLRGIKSNIRSKIAKPLA